LLPHFRPAAAVVTAVSAVTAISVSTISAVAVIAVTLVAGVVVVGGRSHGVALRGPVGAALGLGGILGLVAEPVDTVVHVDAARLATG